MKFKSVRGHAAITAIVGFVASAAAAPASGTVWNFTYSGSGGDTAQGTLTTTQLASGQATITGVSGTYDGSPIIGLIPSGTCCSSPPNDNILYYPSPYLDLPGLGIQTGSYATNIYLDQGKYLDLTAPLNNVNNFTLADSSGTFTISNPVIPVNIYADAFIPYATVNNPGCVLGVCLPGSGGYPTFAGDNRGISSAPGAPYRMAQAISVNASPGSSSPVLSTWSATGISTGFDAAGNPHYGHASTSGLTETATATANGVTVNIDGYAGNPLVPLASKYFGDAVEKYTITITPDADNMISYQVTGLTKLFPGYELYIGSQLVYGYNPASTGTGPGALLNPFPTNQVDASGVLPESVAASDGVGSTSDFPILASSTSTSDGTTTYSFYDVSSGEWFDPASSRSFKFTMLSNGGFLNSVFTEILGFPSGYNGLFTVYVNGVDEGSFASGDTFEFPTDTTSFVITGTDPTDGPFPLQLAFNTPTASFDISTSAVPEPSTWIQIVLGFGFIGAALRSLYRKNIMSA